MSKVVSIRMKDGQVAALQQAAKRWGKTPSAAAARLVEEGLRMREFPFVQFRDTIVGRQVYLQGTRLQVYWVVMLARDYGGDLQKVADHIGVPVVQIESVLRYAEAYRDEIEAEIADFERIDEEELRRLIPNLQVFTARDLEDADAPSP